MAYMKARPREMKQCASELATAAKQMTSLGWEAESILHSLRALKPMGNVCRELNRKMTQMEEQAANVMLFSRTLEQTAEEYARTETKLVATAMGDDKGSVMPKLELCIVPHEWYPPLVPSPIKIWPADVMIRLLGD